MATDPYIAQIFGPLPPDVDVAESHTVQDAAAVIVLLCLASLAVALRFTTRVVNGTGLRQDDWTMLVALLFVAGTTGLSIAGGTFGAGAHVWSITLPDLIEIFKILYAYTFVYAAACATIKISILFFYIRVFTLEELSFKLSVAFGFFLSVSYPLVIWITMANCCDPVSTYWNQFAGAKGECIDVNKFFLALGIVNMLNDVVILAIPIPQIWKLHMSRTKKAAVCGIMLLGSFVCVASIVRIYYLKKLAVARDVTWLMGPVFIWSAIEPSVAIFSACLPHLAPLRHAIRAKISSTVGSKSGGSKKTGASSGTPPWRSRSSRGGDTGRDGALFTYGGSRFNFGENKMMKLVEADDEIGLTNRVTSGGQKADSRASTSDENMHGQSIMVQSTFVQSTDNGNGRRQY